MSVINNNNLIIINKTPILMLTEEVYFSLMSSVFNTLVNLDTAQDFFRNMI